MDWEFIREQFRAWQWFWAENLNKFIAVVGILCGFGLMVHAAHHAHETGCIVSLEDKLFDAGLGVSTFFSGVLGTLIYEKLHRRGK